MSDALATETKKVEAFWSKVRVECYEAIETSARLAEFESLWAKIAPYFGPHLGRDFTAEEQAECFRRLYDLWCDHRLELNDTRDGREFNVWLENKISAGALEGRDKDSVIQRLRSGGKKGRPSNPLRDKEIIASVSMLRLGGMRRANTKDDKAGKCAEEIVAEKLGLVNGKGKYIGGPAISMIEKIYDRTPKPWRNADYEEK